MTTYQQYEQDFVDTLAGNPAMADPPPGLRALLDALPYYGDPDFGSAHRETLRTLLRVNMASDPIAPQPDEADWSHSASYLYQGPYSGYADAFCHGAAATAASAAVAAAAQAANKALTSGWWQDYTVALITDAARQAAGLSLDTGKLTGDLAAMHGAFLSGLTASVLGTMRTAYRPTADALDVLGAAGQSAQACTALVAALATEVFTANINESIAMGGDGAQAAAWFLYNLWIALTALGCPDVDGEIRSRQAAGLTVPSSIGPQRWWDGGYAGWYAPLAGADLAPSADGLLTAGMPEQEMVAYFGDPTIHTFDVTPSNGYSMSLCYWGPLARYTN